MTAIAGVTFGAVGVLLGQVDVPASTPNWLNAIGGVTSLGFAVWYAWFVTTRTIPERDKTHAATINSLVNDFREETKEQRASHAATVERLSAAMERTLSK